MNSRERVFAALSHQQPDRCPVDFRAESATMQTLPYGTVQEVRDAVKRAISILGKDGGYILTSAHCIQNDTPIENILAMYDVALR